MHILILIQVKPSQQKVKEKVLKGARHLTNFDENLKLSRNQVELKTFFYCYQIWILQIVATD